MALRLLPPAADHPPALGFSIDNNAAALSGRMA
jgi:hypothetical protein